MVELATIGGEAAVDLSTRTGANARMVNWNGKRVLVTGAGGFIGSHVCELLVNSGADVRALFHYGSNNSLGALAWAPREVQTAIDAVYGDLRDAEFMTGVTRDRDVVFHLAALVGIPYSYRAPRDVVETNVNGSLNVLVAARDAGCERVIQTSTSEVYGSAQTVPMSEDHPLQAQSPYAASKIAADQLALSFHRSFNLPVSIVRPFNTYGPRQSARAIIPTVIEQALAGQPLRLGSLEPSRDFNYVMDTAEAFLAVAATPAAIGGVFNAGSGRETTIGDVVRLTSLVLGRELIVELDQDRLRPAASEVSRLVADSSRLREICDWRPRTPFETGLANTVEWMAAHYDLSNAARYAV